MCQCSMAKNLINDKGNWKKDLSKPRFVFVQIRYDAGYTTNNGPSPVTAADCITCNNSRSEVRRAVHLHHPAYHIEVTIAYLYLMFIVLAIYYCQILSTIN